MTSSAYTPPLAEGYTPGVLTPMEKYSSPSPYDADEAIRRALQIAIDTKSAQDLTLERIEQTMGLKLTGTSPRTPQDRQSTFLLGQYWVMWVEYMAPDLVRKSGKQFRLSFAFDKAHWAAMPDRSEICRQMDVAAAEKMLLDHGFYNTAKPLDRFPRWRYYNNLVGIEIRSFEDTTWAPGQHACIREIIVSV